MKIEVVAPEDCAGSVVSDLKSRRAQIRGRDVRGNANVITAMVSLKSMFGYADSLRSLSRARATFTMGFDHYAPTPKPTNDP
jgi:elongation factor G